MRLIDADAIPWCEYDLDNYLWFKGVDKDVVDEMPTIEAEPVVRCKECKRMEANRYALHWCNAWNNRVKENDFCSYGVSKDA